MNFLCIVIISQLINNVYIVYEIIVKINEIKNKLFFHNFRFKFDSKSLRIDNDFRNFFSKTLNRLFVRKYRIHEQYYLLIFSNELKNLITCRNTFIKFILFEFIIVFETKFKKGKIEFFIYLFFAIFLIELLYRFFLQRFLV